MHRIRRTCTTCLLCSLFWPLVALGQEATTEADRIPRGTVQSPLRKLRESGEPIAPPAGTASSKVMRYAERLVEKFDRDGDGRLSAEETEGLAESLRVSDFDGDGYITAEEFTRRIMAYSRRRSIRIAPLTPPSPIVAATAPASDLSAPAVAPASEETRELPNGAKRFVVSAARLPGSVPEWFSKSDADGDGQVTLAELTAYAPANAVADFARLDLNGDGVITAEEAVQATRAAERAAGPTPGDAAGAAAGQPRSP